jgi:hypothetical protein
VTRKRPHHRHIVVLVLEDSNREPNLELYSLGDVQATTDGPTAFYGFVVIVDLGRPLLNIAFETQKEAEAVHIAIKPIVAQAKLITAFPTS